MWVGSDVGYNGHRNGFFDNPVFLISCWSSDPNVVGAPRRGARPGRPEGYTFNGKCPAFAIHNDERLTMHQKASGFSGGLFRSILCYNIFQIN